MSISLLVILINKKCQCFYWFEVFDTGLKVVEASFVVCRLEHHPSLCISTTHWVFGVLCFCCWIHWALQNICKIRVVRSLFWSFPPTFLCHGEHNFTIDLETRLSFIRGHCLYDGNSLGIQAGIQKFRVATYWKSSKVNHLS